MIHGRTRESWSRTSEVLAMLANTVRNRKKRSRPYTGRDFSPFRREILDSTPRHQIGAIMSNYPGLSKEVTTAKRRRRKTS